MKIEIRRTWNDGSAGYFWSGYMDGKKMVFLGSSEKEAQEWKARQKAHYEAEESHNDQTKEDAKLREGECYKCGTSVPEGTLCDQCAR